MENPTLFAALMAGVYIRVFRGDHGIEDGTLAVILLELYFYYLLCVCKVDLSGTRFVER